MKHIPLRRCVACNSQREKNELLRIVKENGNLIVDLNGKKEGRGAYICRKEECLEKLKKSKKLLKVLGVDEIDEHFYEEIKSNII